MLPISRSRGPARQELRSGRDIRLSERTLDRSAERLPPVFRILLRPGRLREIGLVCRGVRTARKAVKIEYKGAQAFSAAVYSDHVAHVCNSSKCAGISTPSDFSPKMRARPSFAGSPGL